MLENIRLVRRFFSEHRPQGRAFAVSYTQLLLNEAAPSDKVLALKGLEAFGKAADGKATKIIIPSEIQNLAGLATSVKELMTDGNITR